MEGGREAAAEKLEGEAAVSEKAWGEGKASVDAATDRSSWASRQTCTARWRSARAASYRPVAAEGSGRGRARGEGAQLSVIGWAESLRFEVEEGSVSEINLGGIRGVEQVDGRG